MPTPPNTRDFYGGFDPTNAANISGSDLLALIQNATPYNDKGLTLMTADDNVGNPNVPDADATGKWKQYLWIRRLVSSVVVYAWNPAASSDATYLQWQQVNFAGLSDYSVTNGKIAPGAVTDDKVTSVAYTKILGAPTGLPPNGAAGGDLTGSYPNPTVLANAITRIKLQSDAAVDANRAVGSDHIQNLAVDPTRHFRLGGAGLQGVRIKADSSNYEYATWPVLQCLAKAYTHGSTASTTKVWPADNTVPTYAENDLVVSLTITPLLASSVLRIQTHCVLGRSTAGPCGICLFNGNGTTPALQACNSFVDANTSISPVMLDYMIVSGGVAPITFYIGYGATGASTTYMNERGDGTPLYGGSRNSFLTITELVATLS